MARYDSQLIHVACFRKHAAICSTDKINSMSAELDTGTNIDGSRIRVLLSYPVRLDSSIQDDSRHR